MTKKEKITRIMAILARLFPDPPIPLAHNDPYTLLIAVLLSAQCTDQRVNQVTPKLFAMADNPEAMARCSVASIEAIVRPCGLAPRKAQNIRDLSRMLCDLHHGEVPRTFEELEALPGVGHKTASVVLAQAFGQATAPIDTHIHRLMTRWKLSNGQSVEETERQFKKCFPESSWIKLHLQIIYFGRSHCPARSHKPAQCPICSWANPNVAL